MIFSNKYSDFIKFFVLIKPYWKNLRVFIFCNIIVTLLTLPLPWFSKVLIDDVMLNQDTSLLMVVILAPLFIALTSASLTFLKSYYILYVQHAMSYDIQFRFFKHLQNLSFSFFDKREVAEILSRLRDASRSRQLLIDIVTTFTTNMLYLCIVPFIVFIMHWKLALIAGFTLPWMAFSFFLLSRIVKHYTRRVAEKQATMSAMNFEALSGIREIKSSKSEGRFLRRIKHTYLQYRKLDMIVRTFTVSETLISSLMTAIGTALYTWYGAKSVINGELTVGEFTAFTVFIGYLYNPLTKIVGLLVPIQEVLALTKRFFEYYEIESDIKEKSNAMKKTDIQGKITFEKVTFGYSTDRAVLNDINCEIESGKITAIVGPTGSGKSSLVNLIPRCYDPSAGKIMIDGINIKKYKLDFLHNSIGMVIQQPFIFSGTVYENIVCYRMGSSEEHVVEAAKIAQAHDFILNLERGYDTIIGEKGVSLSGGERQRIALARVVLQNRPIVIMDEATSNLDSKTESKIHAGLKTINVNSTMIIITHRLSAIEKADQIVVLDNGAVVEKGVHEELMEKRGHYYKLVSGKVESDNGSI